MKNKKNIKKYKKIIEVDQVSHFHVYAVFSGTILVAKKCCSELLFNVEKTQVNYPIQRHKVSYYPFPPPFFVCHPFPFVVGVIADYGVEYEIW